MQKTIDKRSFIKKLISLCLLPLVPVSFLLNRRENAIPRAAILRAFQRSPAPRMLKAMLNMKIPLSFVPGVIRKRYMNGKLTTDDKKVFARMARVNFEWSMDWFAKVFSK